MILFRNYLLGPILDVVGRNEEELVDLLISNKNIQINNSFNI